MRIKDSDGFTLVELLAALVITGLVVGAVGSVVTYATKSLDRSVSRATSVASALHTSQMVRYDFAGAQDIFVYGSTAPSTSAIASNFCSSDATLADWGSSSDWQSRTNFVRPLFTADVLDLITADPFTWWSNRRTLVTYEVRRTGLGQPYELWRVICPVISGTPTLSRSQVLVTLAGKKDSLASEPTGTAALKCDTVDCSVLPLTSSATFYSLDLPLSADAPPVLSALEEQLQRLATRVSS